MIGTSGSRWRTLRTWRRRGFTLLEVVVVLFILGVLGTVVGLAWRPVVWASPDTGETPSQTVISAARRRAVGSGRLETVVLDSGGRRYNVTVLPDGRIVGGEPFGFDPLSGRPSDSNAAGSPPRSEVSEAERP